MEGARVTETWLNGLALEFPPASHEFVDSTTNDPKATISIALHEHHHQLYFEKVNCCSSILSLRRLLAELCTSTLNTDLSHKSVLTSKHGWNNTYG